MPNRCISDILTRQSMQRSLSESGCLWLERYHPSSPLAAPLPPSVSCPQRTNSSHCCATQWNNGTAMMLLYPVSFVIPQFPVLILGLREGSWGIRRNLRVMFSISVEHVQLNTKTRSPNLHSDWTCLSRAAESCTDVGAAESTRYVQPPVSPTPEEAEDKSSY